jgi:hypothetical protein
LKIRDALRKAAVAHLIVRVVRDVLGHVAIQVPQRKFVSRIPAGGSAPEFVELLFCAKRPPAVAAAVAAAPAIPMPCRNARRLTTPCHFEATSTAIESVTLVPLEDIFPFIFVTLLYFRVKPKG